MDSGLIINICALVLMIALICSLCYRNIIWTFEDKVFCLLLGTCGVCIISDIMSYIGRFYGGILLYSGNYIYFITRNLTSFLYMCYIITITDRWYHLKRNKVKLFLLIAPIVVSMLIILTNHLTGGVFIYTSEGEYVRGNLIYILYIIATFYVIFSVVYISLNKLIISKEKRIAIYLFLPLTMGAVVIQFFIPEITIEMFSTALCLMLIMFTLQKKEEIMEGTTGLRNRTSFIHDIAGFFVEEKPFCVVSLNIGNLKMLNETIGFAAAEEIVNEVTAFIKRYYNITSDLYAMRNGRFNIVLSKKSLFKFEVITRGIINRFREPWLYHGLELKLIPHIGITNYPGDVKDKEDLINFTDSFHTQVRDSDTIIYAANFHKKDVLHKEELERMISVALRENRFEIYYQPIYSTVQKKFTSAEALIRLYDEKYGFIPPDEFIPVAEETMSILQIGDFVLDSVCKFISEHNLKDLGLDYIEVNLSPVQCIQRDLAEHILEMIEYHGVDPEQINLEITETATIYSPETMRRNMEKLGQKGIRFSLDDYGSGYSNISNLLQFPFSIIKLDKTMVCSRLTNTQAWIALKYSTEMLHEMDLEIVAEGVETLDMVQDLADMKCQYLQGYYFSKPIPKDQFLGYISSNNSVQ